MKIEPKLASTNIETPFAGSSVAVVITTYPQALYLDQAIESVAAQTIAPSEIIVVDDGSTYNPEQVTQKYSQVRLVRQASQGVAAARNTGWRAAGAHYVVFLDAGDRLLSNALEVNLEQFTAHPECGFVYGTCRLIDEAGCPSESLPAVGRDPYVELLRGNCITMHATVMYRRDRLEEIGGFDPSLRACEDYDVHLRLARSFPVAGDARCVAEYRRHSGNLSYDVAIRLRQRTRGAARAARFVALSPDLSRRLQGGGRKLEEVLCGAASQRGSQKH